MFILYWVAAFHANTKVYPVYSITNNYPICESAQLGSVIEIMQKSLFLCVVQFLFWHKSIIIVSGSGIYRPLTPVLLTVVTRFSVV